MKVRYNKDTGEFGKIYAENILIPEPFIILSQEEINDITNQNDKIPFVINGVVVLKDKAAIEAKKAAIAKINEEFKQVTVDYETAMNTAVEYSNGFTYLPKYAEETYQGLIVAEMIAKSQGVSTFPRLIKDSTKLAERAVNMTYAEFIALTSFLADKQNTLWTAKANKEAELLAQKAVLENNEI
jgi:hypothetical protein